VTYDLEQKTRSGQAVYPKVKRVYIAGKVIDAKAGHKLRKRTGKEVNGVRVEYKQTRRGYRRDRFEAKRGDAKVAVGSATVPETRQRFVQIVELPDKARNVHFYGPGEALPAEYRQALQNVR
jgi:hypothetical protein